MSEVTELLGAIRRRRPMLTEPGRLQNMLYRCYANLTMCRMLYTLRHGTVVTKPIAARWALETLDPQWTSLIQDSLAWSRDVPPDLNRTLDFIRYVGARSEPSEGGPC